MNESATRSRYRTVATVIALIGGLLAVGASSTPAIGAEATDGPPQILYTTPQIARPAGGTPIRIAGTGFLGTTSVTFGNGLGQNAPALDFRVVDSTLITATVPSQAAVGATDGNCDQDPNAPFGQLGLPGVCTDITITDNQGTVTGDPDQGNGMYFTDGTLTISPQPIAPGVPFTATVENYAPNADGVLVELNPLVGFLEGDASCATAEPHCPADWTNEYFGPPPYVQLLAFLNPGTDANGGLVCTGDEFNGCQLRTGNEAFNYGGPPGSFVIDSDQDPYANISYGVGYQYDHNISCPPTQETADYGLGQCMIGFSQFARGTLETRVDIGHLNPDGTVTSDQPVPADPTLALSATAAAPGDTVNLSGMYWNNNPWFGSDTSPDDPGETPLQLTICNSDGTGCVAVPDADASVELTRYNTTSTTWSPFTFECTTDPATGNSVYPCTVTPGQPIQGTFSGTNLSGSFVVPDGAGCAPDCVVRVSQEGYDYEAATGAGTGTFISATAPITLEGNGPGFSLTIDDTVVSNGSRGRVTGSITCDTGDAFVLGLTLTQDGASARGRSRGTCTGSAQSIGIGFLTSGPSFTDGSAQACVAVSTAEPGARTPNESGEVCEPVTIDVR